MAKLLSNIQKASIGAEARQAWDRWSEREAFMTSYGEQMNDFLVSNAKAFAAWRQMETGRVLGVENAVSLTVCENKHYLSLLAHFQGFGLAGDTQPSARYLKTLTRLRDDERRRAEWLLEKACLARGLAFPAYPDAVALNQYGHPVSECTADELKRLLYTVTNRRKPAKK